MIMKKLKTSSQNDQINQALSLGPWAQKAFQKRVPSKEFMPFLSSLGSSLFSYTL
jgi:hypothetical protein